MDLTSPFSIIPNELIHQILHRLDVKDVLFSFRYVCSRFYRMTNEYLNYKVRITGTTPESEIRHLCQLIRPENIASIFLSYNGGDMSRISLFLSSISLNRLSRLSSLDLHEVGENNLRELIPHLRDVETLQYLSLNFFHHGSIVDTVRSDLKMLIGKKSLQKLHIYHSQSEIHPLFSSQTCSFHTLYINQLSPYEFYRLMPSLPQLKKFSSGCFHMGDESMGTTQEIFNSLVDLDLKIPLMIVNLIEPFFKKLPSLVKLQLDIYDCTFAFVEHVSSTWEQFIRRHLKSLKQFRFRFRCSKIDYRQVGDMEKVIDRFRSPFWFDLLGASVTCKCINDESWSDFLIHSHDNSKLNFPDDLSDDALCYRTSVTSNEDQDGSICHWDVRIHLTKFANAISTNEMAEPTGLLFRQIHRLALDIDWPIQNFNFLTTLFHFSQLHEIWLFLSTNHFFEAATLTSLLDLARNVQVVGLCYDDDTTMIPIEMLSILDRRINHLKLKTNTIDSMIWVLSNVERLSSVTFQRFSQATSSSAWKDVIEWLSTRQRHFALDVDHRTLSVSNRP